MVDAYQIGGGIVEPIRQPLFFYTSSLTSLTQHYTLPLVVVYVVMIHLIMSLASLINGNDQFHRHHRLVSGGEVILWA